MCTVLSKSCAQASRKRKTTNFETEDKPAKQSKVEVEHKTSHSPEEWAARTEAFRVGCEAFIKAYLASGPNCTSIYDAGFQLTETKAYFKLVSYPKEKPFAGTGVGYTFAIVDKVTGDVYKPTSSLEGTLNKNKAEIKGNIWDAKNGLGRLCMRSGCWESKKPVRNPNPKKPKPVHTLTQDEAKKLLGCLFSRTHSYRAPDIVRIVGWTKSMKRVIVDTVKLESTSFHDVGGGAAHVDLKWLAEHPVTKPQTSGGQQAIYEPAGLEMNECLKMDGDYFFAEDGKREFSWCEY